MTRGNQREVDRQRSKKRAEKNAGKAKKKDKDGNASQALTNKKEKDAEIMRQKQLKAEQKKLEAERAAQNGGMAASKN